MKHLTWRKFDKSTHTIDSILYFFTGKKCEIDIDECQSSPCQNNATCIQGIASYTCNCQPGFTGGDCEVNIDECEVRNRKLKKTSYNIIFE